MTKLAPSNSNSSSVIVDDDSLSTTANAKKLTTLIFDVDDTLYDISTQFTAHRNTYGATSFMIHKLHYPSEDEALQVRNKLFPRFHSTAKILTYLEDNDLLPPVPPSKQEEVMTRHNGKRFHAEDLAEWWATNLDFSLLNGPAEPKLIDMLHNCPLSLVAFSNGPRKYVRKVLDELNLTQFFPDDKLFAVDDVLPYCKPEPDAFRVIFESLKVKPEECIMVEDSMKNVRAAKSLGMKTVLVAGKGSLSERGVDDDQGGETDNKGNIPINTTETQRYDAPIANDPAVDACVEVCSDIPDVLPGLWKDPPVFGH